MELELSDKRKIQVEDLGEGNWSVDGQASAIDLIQLSDKEFHLNMDSVNYRVFVEAVNPDTREVTLRVNGQYIQLRAKDKYESLLESMGLDMVSASKAKDLKAPMPGLVVNVAVSSGQEVEKGDVLLILEAMKMENVIKADAPGVVNEVKVNPKDSVEKGQVLISFQS